MVLVPGVVSTATGLRGLPDVVIANLPIAQDSRPNHIAVDGRVMMHALRSHATSKSGLTFAARLIYVSNIAYMPR